MPRSPRLQILGPGCAGGSPPSEWVSVSVVDETSPHEGHFQVRLQFVEGCPYDLYKKTVYGIDLSESRD